jgi:colicin import membrane protein
MPRIRVYTAPLGFYETAVAARSQKLALAHWGVTRDLFREGTAKETTELKAVEAAMRKVGLVVRRPIGSTGPFKEREEAEDTLLHKLGTEKSKRNVKSASAERRSKSRRPSTKHQPT